MKILLGAFLALFIAFNGCATTTVVLSDKQAMERINAAFEKEDTAEGRFLRQVAELRSMLMQRYEGLMALASLGILGPDDVPVLAPLVDPMSYKLAKAEALILEGDLATAERLLTEVSIAMDSLDAYVAAKIEAENKKNEL